jgi:hypothetical protein
MNAKNPRTHFWLRFGILLLLLIISYATWHFSYRPDSFLRQFSAGLQFLGYTFFAIIGFGIFLFVEMIVLVRNRNKKSALSNLIVLIAQIPLFIILLKLIE